MTTTQIQIGPHNRANILFIASGTPEQVATALLGVQRNFPTCRIDVISRKESVDVATSIPGCKLIYVAGSARGRLRLITQLRRSHYPVVACVAAGNSGFRSLQALPILLGIGNIILFDETGRPVSLYPTQLSTVVSHVGRRFSTRWPRIFTWTHGTLFKIPLELLGVFLLLLRTGRLFLLSYIYTIIYK